MDVNLATAILNEAKAGEFYLRELPENKGELVNDAQFFAEEAKLAFDAGWGQRNSHIVAIVGLTQTSSPELVSNKNRSATEEPPGVANSSLDEQNRTERPERKQGGVKTPLHPLEQLVEKENLPLPMDIDSPYIEMPRDITELTDLRVRKLYSEYSALHNRASWLLAVATADLNDSTHLRDAAFRSAYESLERIDPETGKSKTINQLDQEAKLDKSYCKLADDVVEHSNAAVAWKALSDIYGKNVERLSREMTFRQYEWDKSR